MNINLEYYKIFYHVAKLGSITLAANSLFISQPAVSQSIKQLETALGSSLFFRTPKGVKLTPEGEMLYSYIAQGYEYIKLGENKFKEMLELEYGEVRIGASDMTLQFYLLPSLEAFHKLYPKIKVSVTNAPTPNTIEILNAGKIDFGVVSSPISLKHNLSVTPVCEIEDIFVAGNRYDYLKNEVIQLSDLEKMPIICLEENTSTRRYVNEFLKSNDVTLYPEFELATSDLIVQFAARNLGVGCVVKNFAERYIREGNLFEIKLITKIPPRNICIVTGDKTQISSAGKKLLNMLI
jgi:DNA-binding transcriptional LysR family regulator